MFNGNVRDYPRFKEDFKNLVKSVYGEDAYALKKCLSGDALQTVKGVEGNNIEMMQRLDDKYGNMRKVMDLVISDLKALKKINEGDTKGFVKLVDQVEQCWLDLKNINLEEELNTANIVSHIERVLPNLQKREWIIKAEEVLAAKDLFPTLLKFLQRERRILEYMNSSVRTAGSDKISVHHVSNTSDIVMESEVITLIKQMNEEQQQKNKELESCIVNLTEMVKGSDITLVTHHVAEKLRLKGKDINLSMIKVGNVLENYSSKEYCIPLVDRSTQIWEIKAVGIDEISAKISKKFDVTRVPELFVGVSSHEIDRPSGEIDMLIGVNYSELLPRVVQTNEGLQLLENPFGLSIRGKHNSISNSDNTDNNITVRTHKVSTAMNLNEIKIEPVDKLKNELDKFFALEESGVHCDPRCIKCLCKGCPVSDYVNIKEERELELIEEGLAYDEDGKCWIARYPWIKDPRYLKYNVKVAVARLKTTETRLRKLDVEYAQRYHKEIKDLVKRGVARKLGDEEIKTYNGPIHYIHHHEVLKPESSSTPLRIVFNSSASYMGQKLNDFWAKGPVILNNMLVVLLRFRQEKIAVTGDISKMYHFVKLCNIDQHTHRFLWMDLDVNRPPDHYVLTSVTFGDRPSGTIAMLALRHTVEKFGKGDPEVYDMIVNNTDQIQKESYGFQPFVAVRIAEIQLKTDPKDWWWVDTNQNVADLTSRPCSSDKIGEGSAWQNGPEFLKLPVAKWPIKQHCSEHLPDRIGITMTITKSSNPNLGMIKVERFSKYVTLLRVTCRIMSVFKQKSMKAMEKEPTAEEIGEAEIMWVKEMQRNMTDWKEKYKRLGPVMENGVISTDEVQLSRTGSGWEFITGIRRILLWATEKPAEAI
ncbi:hypothetical protein Pmani_006872 [Petrolisthes manimaculis]|uniref:Uncharacterized protein n=1 Tax=Petrolisthes manimaculis TaxID=1843537 RepID=A0AAE1Q9F9_9EUCA|nr:hypothetical protein Pmani_006872 [Petrolisthes manimaculis]